MKRSVQAAIALLTGMAALVAFSVPAFGWLEHVRFKRQGSVCANDGSTVTIGASVYQMEVGKQGVRRLKVKFLLYDHDPSGAGIDVAVRRKEKTTAYFPDDRKSHWWNGGRGATQTWKVPAGPDYHMVAKLTWDRGAKFDWNTKIPVAVCS